MGIKELFRLCKERAPNSVVTLPISALAGKTIAIDGHQILIGLVRARSDIADALAMFVNNMRIMVVNDINVICVFDGRRRNKTKSAEYEVRRGRRHRTEAKLGECQMTVDSIRTSISATFTGLTGPVIDKICEISSAAPTGTAVHVNSYLARHKPNMFKQIQPRLHEFNRTVNALGKATSARLRLRGRLLYVTNKMIDNLVVLFNNFGITTFRADTEADFVINNLAKYGHIDGVFSADSDMLPHGVGILIRKLDTSTERCDCVMLDTLLEELGLGYLSFVDMCVILGTDYCARVSNHGIKRALSSMHANGTLAGVMDGHGGVTDEQAAARAHFTSVGVDQLRDTTQVPVMMYNSRGITDQFGIVAPLGRINTILVQRNQTMFLPDGC